MVEHNKVKEAQKKILSPLKYVQLFDLEQDNEKRKEMMENRNPVKPVNKIIKLATKLQ